MVAVSVIGKEKAALEKRIQTEHPDIVLSERDPDVILCYGGDGTFLHAERVRPGIPKVFLRRTMLCENCAEQTIVDVLHLVETKAYTIQIQPKIDIWVGDEKRTGAYDVTIGHVRVNKALRMSAAINGKSLSDHIVADALIIATPIGSTGYYESITREHFTEGFGIALSNAVNALPPVQSSTDMEMTVTITRGPGVAVADNEEKGILLNTGDTVTVKKSQSDLQLVVFEGAASQYNYLLYRQPSGSCQRCGGELENSKAVV